MHTFIAFFFVLCTTVLGAPTFQVTAPTAIAPVPHKPWHPPYNPLGPISGTGPTRGVAESDTEMFDRQLFNKMITASFNQYIKNELMKGPASKITARAVPDNRKEDLETLLHTLARLPDQKDRKDGSKDEHGVAYSAYELEACRDLLLTAIRIPSDWAKKPAASVAARDFPAIESNSCDQLMQFIKIENAAKKEFEERGESRIGRMVDVVFSDEDLADKDRIHDQLLDQIKHEQEDPTLKFGYGPREIADVK